jgi:hypothetical protein
MHRTKKRFFIGFDFGGKDTGPRVLAFNLCDPNFEACLFFQFYSVGAYFGVHSFSLGYKNNKFSDFYCFSVASLTRQG